MADKIGSDNKEKSVYLVQIWYLDEQLERCQLKSDELEKQNKDLSSEYSALQKDKKDVTEQLKRAVAAKEKKVEELAERLESQQMAAEQSRKVLELQHRQAMKALQEQSDKLNSDTTMQVTKVKQQKQKLMQLMQQLSNTKSLEKQLVSQREEQEAAIHNLKMGVVLEREMMDDNIQNTVDDCVQRELSDILRVERAQHGERLEWIQFLQDEKAPLQRERDALQDRERELYVRKDNMKEDLKRIVKENLMHKKEVEQLRKTWQQLMEEHEDCSYTHSYILAQIEELREQTAFVSDMCCQKTDEADQLWTELQQESSRSQQLEGVKQEAAIILRHIMMDSVKPSDTQWKMQRLLQILESTAPPGSS
ncbi:cilia- and flagella-associated protein 157 [Seriola aureovittata]|uniref:cilia- and flagella-associated protein 157 n=1 Tax=Seriola aureovittata TaxID=2871759 RepID=UPI0024BEEDBB|nr:cilia- and flagella-associated protein 157 [Seriola aureovittata]